MARTNEYAVDIVELCKEFKRKSVVRGYTSIKSLVTNIFASKKSQQSQSTVVLDNLTMRIPKGASMGVIGKNGAGKSTLLKLITGIYKPTAGHISLNGRVAALIELGAGFHPDFSGRENVFLGGVMQGMTRAEIKSRFDDIVKFAELEEEIDQPVRTYSSGMFMRLGFSLAIHTNPDILIVDEVLAVGDARFVAKCQEKIGELRRNGKTLILVTHDLSAVERWCDEAIWLHQGKVKDRGDPRRVIDSYRHWVEKQEEAQLFEAAAPDLSVNTEELGEETSSFKRWGSREIEITQVKLLDFEQKDKRVFHPEDSCTVEIHYKKNEEVKDVVFGIGIHRADGVTILGTNTDIEKQDFQLSQSGIVRYSFKRLGLLDASYRLDVAIHRQDGYPFDYHEGAINFACRSGHQQLGVIFPEAKFSHA